MAEDNKIHYNLKDLENDLGTGLVNLSTLNQRISNTLNKAKTTHYDYTDFTEFEDENGNILLIRYDENEYEFRGNKYCSYIIRNDKTGSCEEGVAQIKGGQHVRLTEQERVEKIKNYINEQKRLDSFFISLILKLREIGLCRYATSDLVDYAESIVNYATSRAEYNGDKYWLFIRNKFFTEENTYVVFNATKLEIVEDSTLINKIFDLSKYFPKGNKSSQKSKPWWKLW